MGKRKDPNQKGSGAKKHGRNYRLPLQVHGMRSTGSVTRYRARHGIPPGRRRDNHRNNLCPVHNR